MSAGRSLLGGVSASPRIGCDGNDGRAVDRAGLGTGPSDVGVRRGDPSVWVVEAKLSTKWGAGAPDAGQSHEADRRGDPFV